MPQRAEFSAKTKQQAYERCRVNGVPSCEGILADGTRCGAPLRRGRFTYDHRIPDALGGDNTIDNCQVLGHCCDKPKTVNDQAVIGKTRRIRRREAGIKKSSSFRGWRNFRGEPVWKK